MTIGYPTHIHAIFQQVYNETVGKTKTKTEKSAFNAGACALLSHLVEELKSTATVFGTRAVMFGGEEDEIEEVKKSMTTKFKQIKKNYKPSNAHRNQPRPTLPQSSSPSISDCNFDALALQTLSDAPGPAMVGQGMHQQTSISQPSPAAFNHTYFPPMNRAIPSVENLADVVIDMDRQKANQQSPNQDVDLVLYLGQQSMDQQQDVNWYTAQQQIVSQNVDQNNVYSPRPGTAEMASTSSSSPNRGIVSAVAAGQSLIVASPPASALGPNESLPSYSELSRKEPGTPRKKSNKKRGGTTANKVKQGSAPDVMYDFAQNKFFIEIKFHGSTATHVVSESKTQGMRLQGFLAYVAEKQHPHPTKGVVHLTWSNEENFEAIFGINGPMHGVGLSNSWPESHGLDEGRF